MSHDADVLIVGAGPVGTLLAILLGKQGRVVKLIERWPAIYDRPRAVTMDHEVARILATFGIDCDSDPAIQCHEELYYWKNANREDLQIVDWKSVSPSGWHVTYWFNQPELEVRLHGIAAQIPSIELIRGWEAVSLLEVNDGVEVGLQETREIAGDKGQLQSLKAKYVVGADGANSFVREALGIETVDKGYFFDWLILDVIPEKDYQVSPAQWQLCDPARPTTLVPGGPGRRRWEFMVMPDESAEEIAKTESLGWRLNAIVEGKLADSVLDSYVSERIHHAKHYIDFSQELGKIICITDPDEAAERDRSMMAALAERNHEPISGDLVHLGTGIWCENTPAAGELSTQGIVEANGMRDRFDQVVGQGWMVVGFNADPARALTENQQQALASIDGNTVKIGSPGSECDAVDIDGTYQNWLTSIDAVYFILRPDFYVAATANTPEELCKYLDQVLNKLPLSAGQA